MILPMIASIFLIIAIVCFLNLLPKTYLSADMKLTAIMSLLSFRNMPQKQILLLKHIKTTSIFSLLFQALRL